MANEKYAARVGRQAIWWFRTAREAQAWVKENLEGDPDIRTGEADARDGKSWDYRREPDGKIKRTLLSGNVAS